jgi:hypothetical protein
MRFSARSGPNSLLAVALVAGLSSACRSSSEARASIVISEFLASNTAGMKDSDGETSDWVEVYNRGKSAVSLAGWRLTDDPNQTERFVFPEVSLEPGQYLVVFASGRASNPGEKQLHASFRLKASPDYLALLDADGRLTQEFAPYPEQRNDVSYGLGSDGVTNYLTAATPGAPNTPTISKKSKNEAQRENDRDDEDDDDDELAP